MTNQMLGEHEMGGVGQAVQHKDGAGLHLNKARAQKLRQKDLDG